MKNFRKNLIISSILFAISIALTIIYYDKLPVRIPVHYDFAWQADIYIKKFNALLFIVIFMILIYLALYFIITLDPRRKEHDRSYRHIALLSIPILNLLIIGLIIRKAFNPSLNMGKIIAFMICFFILISGLYMPRIKRNYTLGIRTPWSLESDYVWKKTQIFGGTILCFSALLSILALESSLKCAVTILISLLVVTFLASFIYSYLVYRKLGK